MADEDEKAAEAYATARGESGRRNFYVDTVEDFLAGVAHAKGQAGTATATTTFRIRHKVSGEVIWDEPRLPQHMTPMEFTQLWLGQRGREYEAPDFEVAEFETREVNTIPLIPALPPVSPDAGK